MEMIHTTITHIAEGDHNHALRFLKNFLPEEYFQRIKANVAFHDVKRSYSSKHTVVENS